ncbi:CidA/LrgA family protein [Craterilacuibacter sp. RT1T]|uniref:CidA/LrgA family protein n=1 Tax=Craterilacuibacter sp. RT1T TaxID=2942211 RepID=UPI0020BE846C|nr:CidA/LrgA family protein [Craterilacuibacter sp. RT1T]MCL6264219.1 CidA/LrgA family protein [Craterilacuibacter sp. RT1T]
MLEMVLWLIGYQLLGEFIAYALALPVPGAVIGMLLLFITLLLRRSVPRGLQQHVPVLLSNMSLLFIPAGVGLLAWWPLLQASGWRLLLALLLSTLLPLLLSALVLKTLLGRLRGHE